MADLKLPEIQPLTVDRQAGAWDRAGARVQAGFDAAAGLAHFIDKTTLIAKTHEAELQADTGLGRYYETLAQNPTLTSEEVSRDWFDGTDLPASVKARLSDEKGQYNPSASVPFHEIAPEVYDYQARVHRDRAAAIIPTPGWQDQFLQARLKDDAARLQQIRMRTGATQQLVNSISLSNSVELHVAKGTPESDAMAYAAANAIPDAKTRETMLNALPGMIRDRGLTAALRSEDLTALEAGRQQVRANEFDGNARLDAKSQLAWEANFDRRIGQVKQAQYDAQLQGFYLPIQQAIADGRKSGLTPAEVLTQNPKLMDIPPNLENEDFKKAQAFIKAQLQNEDVVTNWDLYTHLLAPKSPLKNYSEQQVRALRPHLAEPEFQEVVRLWRSEQEGAAKDAFRITEAQYSMLQAAVTKVLGIKKDDPTFSSFVGLTQMNFNRSPIRDQMQYSFNFETLVAQTWGAKNPEAWVNSDNQKKLLKAVGTPLFASIAQWMQLNSNGQVDMAQVFAEYQQIESTLGKVRDAWETIDPATVPNDVKVGEVALAVRHNRAALVAQIKRDNPRITEPTEAAIIQQAILNQQSPASVEEYQRGVKNAATQKARLEGNVQGAAEKAAKQREREAAAEAQVAASRARVAEVEALPPWQQNYYRQVRDAFQFVEPPGYVAELAEHEKRRAAGQFSPDESVAARKTIGERWKTRRDAEYNAQRDAHWAKFKEEMTQYEDYLREADIDPANAPLIWPAGVLTFDKWLKARGKELK